MPPLVEVLLPRPFAHPFHYLLPEPWQGRAMPGVRAIVPFGHELLTGVVVHTGAPPPSAASGKLRQISQLIDEIPLVPAELLELLRRLADEYFVPWGELLDAALPSSLLPAGERRYHLEHPVPLAPVRYSRTARRIIALLRDHPKGMSHAALAKQLTETRTNPQSGRPVRLAGVLKRLATSKQIRVTWHIKPLLTHNLSNISNIFTTYRQNYAQIDDNKSHFTIKNIDYDTSQLADSIINCKHSVFLSMTDEHDHINGQQLYLAAVLTAIQNQRSVLLLSPEITRVDLLAGWLQHQVPCPVVVLHSELSPVNLAQRWLALRTVSSPVIVIGTRLALFAPLPSPGLIIVDEEADTLYKPEERPRLHARDLALRRAEQADLPVLLSARAPSVDSYWQWRAGRYHLMTSRSQDPSIMTPAEGASPGGQAGVEVIDLRTEPVCDGLLTMPLIQTLAERLVRHEQSLLFVNRRGYAHSLVCRDCGELVRCAGCRIGLTYYESNTPGAALLRCRRCGTQPPTPTLCPHCRGHRMGPLGTGTQRVQAALRHRWPDAKILRLDRDAATPSDGVNELNLIEGADFIVGTQRCLHTPVPPRLSLVAILDAELDLSHPDFRAEERQLQLLFRLHGLLPPASGPARFLIQSRQPDRPTLQAFTSGRVERLYDTEVAQRRSLGYPPFRRLAALRLRGRQVASQPAIERLTETLRSHLADRQGESAELWGPIPAAQPRRGAGAVWEWLIKAESAAGLHRSLQAVCRMPLTARLLASHALEIEVDPA
jgi:primosomal protein N' (replication factor Y)